MTGRHTQPDVDLIESPSWALDRLKLRPLADHHRRAAWRDKARLSEYRPEALIGIGLGGLGAGIYTPALLVLLAPGTGGRRLALVGVGAGLLTAVVFAWCARRYLHREPFRLPVLIAAGAVLLVRVRGRSWVHFGDGYQLLAWWAPMRPRCYRHAPVRRIAAATLAHWAERDERLRASRRIG